MKEIEKEREEIDFIKYTLTNYPHSEDLEWNTEQIGSCLNEVTRLQARVKELEEGIKKHEMTDIEYDRPCIGKDIIGDRDEELYKLLKKEK